MNIYKFQMNNEEDVDKVGGILKIKETNTTAIIMDMESNNSIMSSYEGMRFNDVKFYNKFKSFINKLISNKIDIKQIADKKQAYFKKNILKLQKMKKEGFTLQDIVIEYETKFLVDMFLLMLEKEFKKDVIVFDCNLFEDDYIIVKTLTAELKNQLKLKKSNILKKENSINQENDTEISL